MKVQHRLCNGAAWCCALHATHVVALSGLAVVEGRRAARSEGPVLPRVTPPREIAPRTRHLPQFGVPEGEGLCVRRVWAWPCVASGFRRNAGGLYIEKSIPRYEPVTAELHLELLLLGPAAGGCRVQKAQSPSEEARPGGPESLVSFLTPKDAWSVWRHG